MVYAVKCDASQVSLFHMLGQSIEESRNGVMVFLRKGPQEFLDTQICAGAKPAKPAVLEYDADMQPLKTTRVM